MSSAEIEAMDAAEESSLGLNRGDDKQWCRTVIDVTRRERGARSTCFDPAKTTHGNHPRQNGRLDKESTGTSSSTGTSNSKNQKAQDIEELEYEKELITKLLKKLVKDKYLLEVRGDVQESLPESASDGTVQQSSSSGRAGEN
ncbi:hypothetical protein JVU11DRAFT_2053 [Chiua virens]|nr:hypothetical protein JVU11DRAFT_2053 [Chiua virens]